MSSCCDMMTPAGVEYPPSSRRPSVVYPAFKEELEPRQLFPQDSMEVFDDDECLASPLDVTPPPVKQRLQRSFRGQGQFREMGERARSKYQNKMYQSSVFGKLEEYADPSSWNRAPALINYCISEIETRSTIPFGLYSKPACRHAVMDIINTFIEIGPNPEMLMDYDSHTLANCIIYFLSNLEEPVIPQCMRKAFFRAEANARNSCGGNTNEIEELVLQLPEASQDTLRRICPHLMGVTRMPTAHQSVLELATVFGPLLFGITEDEPSYAQSALAMMAMIRTDFTLDSIEL